MWECYISVKSVLSVLSVLREHKLDFKVKTSIFKTGCQLKKNYNIVISIHLGCIEPATEKGCTYCNAFVHNTYNLKIAVVVENSDVFLYVKCIEYNSCNAYMYETVCVKYIEHND